MTNRSADHRGGRVRADAHDHRASSGSEMCTSEAERRCVGKALWALWVGARCTAINVSCAAIHKPSSAAARSMRPVDAESRGETTTRSRSRGCIEPTAGEVTRREGAADRRVQRPSPKLGRWSGVAIAPTWTDRSDVLTWCPSRPRGAILSSSASTTPRAAIAPTWAHRTVLCSRSWLRHQHDPA